MTELQLIFLIIVFLAVSGIAFIIIRLATPRVTQARLDQIAADGAEDEAQLDSAEWEQRLNRLTGPFASLALPSEGWENSPVRTRFMHAGYRAKSVPNFYFGGKILLALLLPLFFLLFVGVSRSQLDSNTLIFLFICLANIGYYLPNIILARLIFVRQRDLFENFPDAIDLMTVCIEAGLGLDAAMKKVSEEMYVKCRPLAEELHLINLEMRAGRTREDALRNLAMRTGVEEIEGLVSMLIQADRFGTSIAVSLRVHSDMLRTKRRLRAEEAAAKIALKLLFPLTFFIFPALFVVVLGPAAIQVYRNILPVLTGGIN